MIFISLLSMLWIGVAHGSEASVTALHGSAYALNGNAETPLKMGTRVSSGTTVRTADNSLLVLAFADGTRLKLKAKSMVQVQGDSKAQSPSGVELIAGALFALVPKADKRHFEVKTKSAVAGVRGTEFFTSLGENNVFWLCVQDGAVDVKPTGSEKSLLVPKGLGVLVESGKIPEPPKPYAWTKKLNWNMEPENGDVLDTSSIENEYKSLLRHRYD